MCVPVNCSDGARHKSLNRRGADTGQAIKDRMVWILRKDKHGTEDVGFLRIG